MEFNSYPRIDAIATNQIDFWARPKINRRKTNHTNIRVHTSMSFFSSHAFATLTLCCHSDSSGETCIHSHTHIDRGPHLHIYIQTETHTDTDRRRSMPNAAMPIICHRQNNRAHTVRLKVTTAAACRCRFGGLSFVSIVTKRNAA